MQKTPDLDFVSWKEFARMCEELAEKIEVDGQKYDSIVSISRGGHVVSRILSDLLGISIFNVSIQSYDALQQKEVQLTQKLGRYLEGQNILLIDEIVDTGITLQRAVAYLKRLRVKNVVTVALHVKPRTQFHPDYAARETTAWVVYPYEVRETMVNLYPIWKKAGWSKQKMAKVLTAGKFPKHQVEKYLDRLS